MTDFALRNTPYSYGFVARLLHWVSVFLLLFVIIYTPDSMATEAKNKTTEFHILLGGMFAFILLTRFVWRQVNVNPIYYYNIAAYQKLLAISLHRTIYVVMLIQCATGIVLAFSQPYPLVYFSNVKLMPLFEDNVVSVIAFNVHIFVSSMIYPLLFIHVSAAIYHQVFGVIERKYDT